MQEAGQDPWIGSKLSSLLTDIDFDVLDVQEKYLSYGNIIILLSFYHHVY